MKTHRFREAAMNLLSAFQPVPIEVKPRRPNSRSMRSAIARLSADADALCNTVFKEQDDLPADPKLLELIETMRIK